jgi:hypothetical protein
MRVDFLEMRVDFLFRVYYSASRVDAPDNHSFVAASLGVERQYA